MPMSSASRLATQGCKRKMTQVDGRRIDGALQETLEQNEQTRDGTPASS